MANTDVGIYRRCLAELSLGTGPGTSLCRFEKLQSGSFLALFCRESGRCVYGVDNFCRWLDHASAVGLV